MRLGRDPLIDQADARQGVGDNFSVGIGFDRGDEVEVIAHGDLVGAEPGPFVANEADAFGGAEEGFGIADQFVIDAERIGAAVVAFATGVGEEEPRRRIRRQCRAIRGEDLAVLLVRAGFHANGEGPLLRGVGLDAGA